MIVPNTGYGFLKTAERCGICTFPEQSTAKHCTTPQNTFKHADTKLKDV